MNDISIGLLLFFLFLLVLISGFFSGSETGVMSLNRYRLKHLARKKKLPAAIRTLELLKRPDRLLGVILIGNTFANILASAIATIIAVKLFGDIGVAIATVLLTLIILVFSEVTPKTLAATHPQKFAFIVSLPLKLLLKLLYPLVWLVNTIANNFLKLFKINLHSEEHGPLTQEELRTIVKEAGDKMPTPHQEMLLRILDLEQIAVDDVMIPRNEVVGLDLDDDWPDLLKQITHSQHTHLPLFNTNLDNIIGIVHLRTLLRVLNDKEFDKNSLEQLAVTPYYIPENTPVNIQLMQFKKRKLRTGLVVDEYGDIQGLVSLEDILSEILGELANTQQQNPTQEITPQKDGSYIVDGGINLRELNRYLGWELPIDGPKTLSGLIVEYLESIPDTETSLKLYNHPMEIIQIKENMIKTVKVYSMG